jgi:hypothetical protein
MQADIFSGVERFHGATVGAMKRLGQIHIRTLERLAQHQLNTVRILLEGSQGQLIILKEARGARELLSSQLHVGSELGQRFAAHTGQTLEIFMDAQDECAGWVSEGLHLMANRTFA